MKNLPANTGDITDVSLIPGSTRAPGDGNSTPLQYSCLENPMDGGAWRVTIHWVAKSRTWLKRLSMHTFCAYKIKSCLKYNFFFSPEIFSSIGSQWKYDVKTWCHFSYFGSVQSLSRVRLFATLQAVAHQAPLSMWFSRQEHWSGLPFPSPEDPPDPGIEPSSLILQADALTSEPPEKHPARFSTLCYI